MEQVTMSYTQLMEQVNNVLHIAYGTGKQCPTHSLWKSLSPNKSHKSKFKHFLESFDPQCHVSGSK